MTGKRSKSLPLHFSNGLLAVCVLMAFGCRSQAHRDLYADKMASEIRVLEDQLYEADYENRVLRQKLQNTKTQGYDADPDTPKRGQRRAPTPPQKSNGQNGESLPAPNGDARTELLTPPGAIPRDQDDDALQDQRVPVPQSSNGRGDDALIPPDLESLQLPDIDMGELLPPAGNNDTPELPELPFGQIPLPPRGGDVAQPVSLWIHPTLSGPYRSDETPSQQGVELVIQFMDQAGKVVDLSNIDIDADLHIVLVDTQPDLETEQRLGSWDFTSEQLAELRAQQLRGDSIRVVVPLDERQPQGERITALVRLSNGDFHLEGKSQIVSDETTKQPGWLPRSESLATPPPTGTSGLSR